MNGLMSLAAVHPLLFLAGVTVLLLGLLLLRQVLARLFRFLLRTGVGLAALFACSRLGLGLGVNLANAAVVGLLGLPGLGLLFLLRRLLVG